MPGPLVHAYETIRQALSPFLGNSSKWRIPMGAACFVSISTRTLRSVCMALSWRASDYLLNQAKKGEINRRDCCVHAVNTSLLPAAKLLA